MLIATEELQGDAASAADSSPLGAVPDENEGFHEDAWQRRATDIADWLLPLVVRRDCHGGHVIEQTEGYPAIQRTTVHSPLTREILEEHFAAEDASTLCGLHVTSPDEQGLLVVVDIDAHGDPGDDPVKNQALARHVYDEARRLGFAALLLDSNGHGGFHVWVLLGRMAPMSEAWRLGKYLIRDHQAFGLATPPETFPKSPYLTGKRFGGWVRIFGRHHKGPFWTRVWDERRERWEVGDCAVALILATTPVPVDVAAILPADFAVQSTRDELAEGARSWRSLVCGHRRNLRFAREALGYLRGGEVDRYVDWLLIGMCLAELGEDGLRLWDDWSRQSTKYRPGNTWEKWQTFQAASAVDPRTVGLGTLYRMGEAYGFRGHLASRRWAQYQDRGSVILDDGEDPERLADEARDQKFSLACDEAIAALESRPDLRDQLAVAWGVSAKTTQLVGAGLREDLERWMDQYMPTGRWAITVPLSSAGGLTTGFLRFYPTDGWKSRPAWGGRPGLVLPWGVDEREGPLVICGDPTDTARILELGGCAVGLPDPTAPLDDLTAFLTEGRDVVVAPGADGWADQTAYSLGQLTGRTVKVLSLPEGVRSLRDCILENASEMRKEHQVGNE